MGTPEEPELITRLCAVDSLPAIEAGTDPRRQARTMGGATVGASAYLAALTFPPWCAIACPLDALPMAVASIGTSTALTAIALPPAIALANAALGLAHTMTRAVATTRASLEVEGGRGKKGRGRKSERTSEACEAYGRQG